MLSSVGEREEQGGEERRRKLRVGLLQRWLTTTIAFSSPPPLPVHPLFLLI
jgi:hypothetical protein